MDKVSLVLRKKHYAYRTEQAYGDWIKRFILFNDKKHPKDMGEQEISRFISHLAIKRKVAASTQNQALNAIVFLYKHVLKKDLGDFGPMERAKRPKKLPVVLTKKEVKQVLGFMVGRKSLIAKLLYGSGLRLRECLRLRVKDLEFEMNQVAVRSGKGDVDRNTILPESTKPLLNDHLEKVKMIHERDLKMNLGAVYLPFALARKYKNAAKEWGWQYVFPSDRISFDPRSRRRGRHHLDDSGVQKAVRSAGRRAEGGKARR